MPGYDLCTGLGTPTGTNLINALTASGVNNPITHLSPPPPPYGSTLTSLNGGNPNGSWYLFVQDDKQLDSGVISNGWVLALTTANPVGLSANLVLSMSASPTNAYVGGNVVYIIGVTNYGPSTSSNSIVVDTFSSGVTLISTTTTQGSVNGLNWNIGTLASGAGAQLTLTVRPISPGSILNSAIVDAAAPDPNPGDNSVSISVNVAVVPPPVLSGSGSTNGTFRFSFTSAPGQTNVIQATTNLLTGWVPLYTNVGSGVFIDYYATNYPYRFYRDVLIGP